MCAVLLALSGIGALEARAQEAGLSIELNRLDTQAEACQAFLVMENGTEIAFEELVLDLVMFGDDGIIARRLAVDIAPLRAGRISVKVFAVEGTACEAIGRVLLNDVLSCAGAEGPVAGCFDLIDTRSRVSAEFLN
ncbi:MAG: Tat pathway signal sequence domain protein [Pseudomonadota bacterium]